MKKNIPRMAEIAAPIRPTQSQLTCFFRPAPVVVQREYKNGKAEGKEMLTAKFPSGSSPVPPLEKYLSKVSGGQALSKKERHFFESRMNTDFGKVRMHTERTANESAESIQALAYTHGNHIIFGAEQYQPHTEKGKKLIAHELTHVIQQNSSPGVSRKLVQRHDDPTRWCSAFMDLVHYEDVHGKWGVITHYHSLSNDRLIPLNYNIPSIFGDVDVDWMFRLAFIQYPFIVSSIITPSMSEGFGGLASRIGQIGLKGFWNTIRAAAPEWDLEYGSILEEGNWNSSTAVVAWIHQDLSLRDIFSPAISLC